MSQSPDSGRPDRNSESFIDEKPFRLAKSFSLIAIIMIFAAVLILVTVVSRQAEIIITKRVEDDTIKLMENLNHQMYENFLKKVHDPLTGKSRLREPGQQELLHEVITNTIYGFDLQRVLLYAPDEGRVVYDTDKTLVNSWAEGPDLQAYQDAIALYVPSAPDSIKFAPWWAGGGYHLPSGADRFPRSLSDPRWPEGNYYPFSPYPNPLNQPPLGSRPPAGIDQHLPQSEKSDLSWLWSELRPLTDDSLTEPDSPLLPTPTPTLEITPKAAPPENREDAYLDSLRAQTVFRYEGGSFLFFNFFPSGNFVLRSYKAMEDKNYKYSAEAALCQSDEAQADPVHREICRRQGLTGVVEVDRDLTPEYRQIARLQYFALSVAFFLALGLTVVLRWVVSRGEAIITKRNLERQALRERLDQAERLAGLGSLVATVAHEIRNPLGIIHSTADVLNRYLSSDPAQARLAQAIVEEANRLSEVVTEFLDFARPPTPRLTPMVVEEVLEEILAFLEVTLTRAGVEVRTDFREDPTPTPGDAHMLHRAFLNILVNAIQAMDDGGLICISTRLEPDAPDGGRLAVTFSDTGPGLSEEAIKKQFSPFYTTKAKGTGLGLVIVRNIIEGHGGEIELKNGPPPKSSEDGGPGLTVTIRLKV